MEAKSSQTAVSKECNDENCECWKLWVFLFHKFVIAFAGTVLPLLLRETENIFLFCFGSMAKLKGGNGEWNMSMLTENNIHLVHRKHGICLRYTFRKLISTFAVSIPSLSFSMYAFLFSLQFYFPVQRFFPSKSFSAAFVSCRSWFVKSIFLSLSLFSRLIRWLNQIQLLDAHTKTKINELNENTRSNKSFAR